MKDDILLVEKYRPGIIHDCVLPAALKKTFKSFVKKKEFPNLLLSGPAGVGKTTVAKALCIELDYDWIFINGSLNAGIDKLRNDISKFASGVSLNDSAYKVVILDEADYLSREKFQPALRGFIEEFSSNCRFILTCNFKNRIITPLRESRLSNIDFTFPNNEIPLLMAGFMERLRFILDQENIEYENKVIAEVIKKFFPDFRRIINEIERYSKSGKIDSGILSTFEDADILSLIKTLKDKDFTKMRAWVASNRDNDPNTIFLKIYESMYNYMTPGDIPQAILLLSEYQDKATRVVNQEINLVAFLTEIMAGVEFL